MNRHLFREQVLYRAAGGAVLAGIGMFMPLLGIGSVNWRNVLVLSAVLALFTAVSFLPVRGKALCLLSAVFCLSAAAAIAGFETSISFLKDYLGWCMGYGVTRAEWREGFWLIQTGVIAACAFLLQILSEKFRIIKAGLACIIVLSMSICLIAQISLTHMSVVFALLYLAVICVEYIQEKWKKNRDGSVKELLFWLVPYFAVYLLLMALMPAPAEPYDWKWAQDIYSRMKDSFLAMTQNLLPGGRENFDTALSGFSGDGELGGDVRRSDRQVMRIQTRPELVTNVYLTGKMYDTFDGRQWQQEYSGGEEDRFIDTLETLYAARMLDDGYLKDYLREVYIGVRYEFFDTGYVFAPLKTKTITENSSILNYTFDGGNLLLDRRRGYGTEYNVVFYQLNAGEELFERLLQMESELDPEIWEATAREFRRQTGHEFTLEMMETHWQNVYENYLEPVGLSAEVESYLSEITAGAETALEKLRAIERELASFTYTRMPGELPDKVTDAGEFLDYFLLESRQGYCTYFATAFVLLARAQGMPARYVQGFCVPTGGNGETLVLSGMAHSWPEVYIQGVGWFPFEPTPGYGGFRYTPWGVSVRYDSSSQGRGEVSDGKVSEVTSEETWEDGDTWENEDAWSQETGHGSGPARILKALAFCFLAILAGFVLVFTCDKVISMYRYRRMSAAEKLKAQVRENLRLLNWLGLVRQEQETLQELRSRGILMPGMPPLHFIENYEDVLYGGKPANEGILKDAGEERRKLWDLLWKEKKFSYVFYRLRMFLSR